MGDFSRHANAFTQGWMWVDGFTHVDGIRAHFDGQRHFTNHVACMRTDHAAAEDFAVAVGLG